MLNTVWVNADHGRDFHPLANHMTKLKLSIEEAPLRYLNILGLSFVLHG